MTTQPTCSVHGAKHLFVFVGERNGADWFRCACMAERRNAREALEPDSDFTIADVACEAEATALLGDDAVQAAVLMRQLEASLAQQSESPEEPRRFVCDHGTLDPDNPHDPCMLCAMACAEEMPNE